MSMESGGWFVEIDSLTGLWTHPAFMDRLGIELKKDKEKIDTGKSSIVYFDVQRFKMINNMFGMEEGNRLLSYIGEAIQRMVDGDGFGSRLSADRFVLYLCVDQDELERRLSALFEELSDFGLPFEILCNAGIYRITDSTMKPDAMVDYAIMAQSQIKGSYINHFHYYNEDLHQSLLVQQEIIGMMGAALQKKQFVVYYQPQYNHSTRLLVGAEALVRWKHPQKGLLSPAAFLAVFENNGFIKQMDRYVFEQVCIFVRSCLNHGISIVPISVNLSRCDILSPGFIEQLEHIRESYGVPVRYIRIELTESFALEGSQWIHDAVEKLHGYGYVVEMDDFGSGYSSLNILKDIEFDIVKLDMRFLEHEDNERAQARNERGGTILSSVVRMLNWLRLPIIAEGVETTEQADYLRSIGCDCVQGFLYRPPIPQEEYETLLKDSRLGETRARFQMKDARDASKFWSDQALETLLFSDYVGAAALISYDNERTEILRINKKCLQELGMNLLEKDILNKDIFTYMEPAGLAAYKEMLETALATGEEQECETWRVVDSPSCGTERVCIRTTVHLIGHSQDSSLFYARVRNVTAEKKRYAGILDEEQRFQMASEQANIYYWEYNVMTQEMHPCFRCMRDMGFPAVVKNYPDTAIEMGIFPPEIADEYRDWHRQIAAGVPQLEGVLPLTVGRVPFHVRYTTVFDEDSRPIKAYGSATLVVDA